MLHRLIWIAILALAAAATAAAAQTDPYADAREQFLAAWAGVDLPPPEPAAAESEALRSYPLYPYLQAGRLQHQLKALPTALPATSSAPSTAGTPDGAAPSPLPLDFAIESFLAPLGDQPVTRALRHDWLASLAMRHVWAKYLDVYSPERDGSDDTLRCQSFAARIALGRVDGLAAAITESWLSPKPLPETCDAAFDWLRARNALGDDLIERRARLALANGESGLGRFLARSLPSATAAPLLQWADLIEQPGKAVDALIATPSRAVENDALLDGWTRFARGDSEAAAARLPALIEARKLNPRGTSPFVLAVALAQSWSRMPGALENFARVDPDDFDERAHEWRARAALWAGDWPSVSKAIEAMPEALRNQNRWRYWAARSAQQLGDRATAQQGYAAVVPTDNWYAVLAAARLGEAFAPHPQALSVDEAGIVSLGTEPGFVRAHELLLCQLNNEASNEWRTALDAQPPERQLLAVGLAARWGWHQQAIAAAARQGLFNDYGVLYPRPFDAEVRAAAARTGLDEDLIYAIIRQESLYRADAGSRAGALGLMQLVPETARRTAKRWGLPAPSRASLLIPSVNVPLGAATLKDLLDRAAGQVPLAVGGYNAGPGAVRRWLPPAPMETDRWVENIPFNETRAYVQRVAWHSLVFAWLDDRKPRDVSNWLGTIQAPAAD
jgi:soluble lytic murein transglycosylase